MRHSPFATLAALCLSAAAASAPAQSPGGRVAVPAADADWVEVARQENGIGYVDRRSIRFEAGRVRYMGRILYDPPQENGTVEIDHVGEIDCARRTFRPIAFDTLGSGGRVLVSLRPSEADVPAQAINPDSPNARLHQEHCR